ncbi:hypothetical protein NLX86_18870 [Streptomyces sp. A3M-1-3]|uniref:hypothetical protein n=1 Tax=Streptomyces sp. A3M-1-3 TaxID=2962044 RepID=UPI0020B8237A|nr:hypothetical protein [Streptomyces sp. A3M-1-3]MCP3820081.1 hypothetical protein [Streptomyces sp. A3M-1-3]
MHPAELYPDDLVFEHEATEATGVPGPTIRKWASRGKIRRYEGDPRQYSGQGHEYKTMYALPEVREQARQYKPTPQRAPKAA